MKLYSDTEIMNLISRTSLKFTDNGDHIKFRCLNPTHHDKSPSMTMLKHNGFAKCWSCGQEYCFTQLYYKITGVKLVDSQENFSPFLNKMNKPNIKAKVYKEKNIQYKLEKGNLYTPMANQIVIKYLNSINVYTKAINYFGIKYCEQMVIGFDPDKKGTFIKNRICIPIQENWKLVNMECRDFTGTQKLKVIYPKGSKADVLFNYDNLNKKQTLIVVEGIKSALRIWQYFDKNVTATLGSAIGKNQKTILNEFKDIILFPDNDKAGKNMIKQFNDFYNYDYRITFMGKEDHDPADGTLDELTYALSNSIDNACYTIDNNLEDIFSFNKKLKFF